MGKKVLFLAPKVANIYLDIIAELERQQYEVDYFEYKSYKLDPHYLKGYVKYGRVFTSKLISSFIIKRDWKKLLASEPYNKVYDYLFVIDGYSLHPCLFEILRERNSQLKAINYLFDTCRSNYEFNVHFPYFDKVATFDIEDSRKFHVDLLPIYWIEYEGGEVEQDIDMFGMGTCIDGRFQLFTALKHYSDSHYLNSIIQLYLSRPANMRNTRWKTRIVNALSSKKVMPHLEWYSSPLITHKQIPTSEYRKLIKRSKIVLDSNAAHQDGLTARFMWSLGEERKIITTNKAVKEYDFYTPEQIFVVDSIGNLLADSCLDRFVNSDFHMNEILRQKVNAYRIDNWIKTLFAE